MENTLFGLDAGRHSFPITLLGTLFLMDYSVVDNSIWHLVLGTLAHHLLCVIV